MGSGGHSRSKRQETIFSFMESRSSSADRKLEKGENIVKSKESIHDITIPRVELEKLGINVSSTSKFRFKKEASKDKFVAPYVLKKSVGIKTLPKLKIRSSSVINKEYQNIKIKGQENPYVNPLEKTARISYGSVEKT